jgi:hypothetical protein
MCIMYCLASLIYAIATRAVNIEYEIPTIIHNHADQFEILGVQWCTYQRA